MSKLSGGLIALLFAAVFNGCAHNAPRYPTNYAASMQLKEAGLSQVSVGTIAKNSGKGVSDVDKLTIRGGTFRSPYGSYTEYLRAALRDELDRAELLKENADLKIEGVLVRNVLNAAGVSVGFAEVEAKLVVKRGGVTTYEDTKSARHEWPSNFVGAIAIPKAASSYPMAIRKLLMLFYEDPKFIAALK